MVGADALVSAKPPSWVDATGGYVTSPSSRLAANRRLSGRRALLDLHLRVVLKRSQYLIAARHNFIPGLESISDFCVGHAHDSCLGRDEHGATVADRKYSLNLFFALILIL